MLFLVYWYLGGKVASFVGALGFGGTAAVKGVKSRAKKKHMRIADDPDAIQRDNLDRLRSRSRTKLGKTLYR